jgi:hypothetical protein
MKRQERNDPGRVYKVSYKPEYLCYFPRVTSSCLPFSRLGIFSETLSHDCVHSGLHTTCVFLHRYPVLSPQSKLQQDNCLPSLSLRHVAFLLLVSKCMFSLPSTIKH